MADELATILRLVAEGTLTPDEAAPIIDALSRPSTGPRGGGETSATASRLRIRIQVMERGRRVVDVRIPIAFAAVAARMVPGISERYASLIEEAAEAETIGTIVDAEDENGDGVIISTE